MVCAAELNWSLWIAVFSLTSVSVASAQAYPSQVHSSQVYPSKIVRLVVPLPPGGPPDLVARLYAAKITELWGQPVVVENRPGASGNIGSQLVANSPADGYTLLLPSTSFVVFNNPSQSLPYIKTGKLHALATTGTKRMPQVPELPTVSGLGYPGFDVGTWFELLGSNCWGSDCLGSDCWGSDCGRRLEHLRLSSTGSTAPQSGSQPCQICSSSISSRASRSLRRLPLNSLHFSATRPSVGARWFGKRKSKHSDNPLECAKL